MYELRAKVLRALSPRRRPGAAVMVGTLLAGVLVASFGAGYSASRPELDSGKAYLPGGDDLKVVNGETQRVEAEARALATGQQELETVVLSDSRLAVVNHATGKVTVVGTEQLDPQGTIGPDGTNPSGDRTSAPDKQLAVVPANSTGYLVDPVRDVVETIDPNGAPGKPVSVPGGATVMAVPDGSEGIWVLTDDGKAAHVVRDAVRKVVSAPDKMERLTVADTRPIAITAAGEALDVAADPIKPVTSDRVPHGPAVVVGSVKGAGRHLLVLDRKGKLVVVDPRTKTPREFTDLPGGAGHNLGAPVTTDDLVYVPDHAAHKIYVRDIGTGARLPDVDVPGKSPMFSLEVREGRVWANDQFDRRAVMVGRDKHKSVVDKGPGDGVKTDTTNGDKPEDKPATQPVQNLPPIAQPPPLSTTPPPQQPPGNQPPVEVTVPVIPRGTPRTEACDRISAAGLTCAEETVGTDGPSNTVRDTSPAGGAKVPPHSVVVVRVYAQIGLPEVVGRRTAAACQTVEGYQNARLRCDKQPMQTPAAAWKEVDVVAAQSPNAGAPVDTGATVTVRFFNHIPADNFVGQNAAQACGMIISQSGDAVKCEVRDGPPAPTPAHTAQVHSQTPAPGTKVYIGDTITLVQFGNALQTVPELLMLSETQACDSITQRGFVCVVQRDGVGPDLSVTAQDQPPGTPLPPNSQVVVHIPSHAAVPLHLYKHVSLPVYIIRFQGDNPGGPWQAVKYLGKAYPPAAAPAGLAPVREVHCASGPDCLGYEPNYYYTRDYVGLRGWTVLGDRAFLHHLNGPSGGCPAGLVQISRMRIPHGSTTRYVVDHPGSGPPTVNYEEPLGCLWPAT